ncbi:MAG TPA: amino acid permease, partial [Pseudonocardiaceae bacterium]
VAAAGALLALFTGVGRTTLAMARNGDLPRGLAAVHERYAVPHRAGLLVALVVCGLVLTTDLRGAIGFSSFGVLVYYAVANAAAFTLRRTRFVPALGLALCVLLVVTLPWPSVLTGAAVLAAGLLGRAVARRRPASRP